MQRCGRKEQVLRKKARLDKISNTSLCKSASPFLQQCVPGRGFASRPFASGACARRRPCKKFKCAGKFWASHSLGSYSTRTPPPLSPRQSPTPKSPYNRSPPWRHAVSLRKRQDHRAKENTITSVGERWRWIHMPMLCCKNTGESTPNKWSNSTHIGGRKHRSKALPAIRYTDKSRKKHYPLQKMKPCVFPDVRRSSSAACPGANHPPHKSPQWGLLATSPSKRARPSTTTISSETPRETPGFPWPSSIRACCLPRPPPLRHPSPLARPRSPHSSCPPTRPPFPLPHRPRLL